MRDFDSLIFGRFAQPDRCENESRNTSHQCLEVAVFLIDNGSAKPTRVCLRCMATAVDIFSRRGLSVMVSRLDNQ